jgi:formimidoylglutamate deiminase
MHSVFLSQGWARDVLVTVDDDGLITAIQTADPAEGHGPAHEPTGTGSAGGAASSSESRIGGPAGFNAQHGGSDSAVQRIDGIVIPGMANAHSHAFQRAMAGNTEYRLSARDSFWTWRTAMYALANRIEPADLQVLATQLFIEMLKSGYTSVAEFHYLHRQTNGAAYSGANALWEAIGNAASAAGIALTFLPTLYQSSDFGGQSLKPEQARFASDTDAFLRAVEARISAERRSHAPRRDGRAQRDMQAQHDLQALHDLQAQHAAPPQHDMRSPRSVPTQHDMRTQCTGVAFHSLRAVPLENLRRAAQRLRELDATLPLHIHVAEQVLEVQACVRHSGRRPIELLLDTGLLDQHWCLVHATHATLAELKGIAASAATVCVSISTEANLGDGFFDTARFLKAGGRLCVGSDSQSTVSPTEELRWLEYQQRLRKKRRGVLAGGGEAHVGTRLWRDAAQHGAQAIGQPAGAIAVGRRADWVVLDAGHPSLVGTAADAVLDHLLFAGGDAAIRDVMVAGRWAIKNGHHAAEDELRPRFADLMRRLSVAK